MSLADERDFFQSFWQRTLPIWELLAPLNRKSVAGFTSWEWMRAKYKSGKRFPSAEVGDLFPYPPRPLCQNVGKKLPQSLLSSMSLKAVCLTLYLYMRKVSFGIRLMEKLHPRQTTAIWELSSPVWFQEKFLESHCRESDNVGLAGRKPWVWAEPHLCSRFCILGRWLDVVVVGLFFCILAEMNLF